MWLSACGSAADAASGGGQYPHQLSGGQQQRVALARALAIRPDVVLLDEPFASLDAQLRASVRADVLQICRAAGTTAVLVTHDQDEALSMADRVAVLRDGRIAQYATPRELYRRPADPGLARFVGDANLLEGRLAAAAGGAVAVDTVLGRLAVEPAAGLGTAGTVTVLVRPEQLDIVPAGPAALTGRVMACEYYGHDAVVRIEPDGDPAAAHLIVRAPGGHLPAPGSPVAVTARGPVLAWAGHRK